MWLTDKKTILAVAFFVLIGEFAYVASVNSGQEPLWWYDIVLHFLGGALIAMIFLNLTREFKDWWSYAGVLQMLISATAVVLSAGVLWEFYEFVTAYFFHSMALTLSDTLSDLFFDSLGGFLLSAAHIFLTRKN